MLTTLNAQNRDPYGTYCLSSFWGQLAFDQGGGGTAARAVDDDAGGANGVAMIFDVGGARGGACAGGD